jgi:voltage-gated potassium channel
VSPGPLGRRQLLLGAARTVGNVVALLLLYFLLPLDRAFTGGTAVVLLLGLLLIALLVAAQVRAILHSPNPALRAVEAVTLSVPLFLVLFAAAYQRLSAGDPQAFTQPLTRIDGIYFVVTVFSTVGFGDIAPVSQLARVLITVQMLLDLVLIGLVLKVFLAAVDRGRRRTTGEGDSGIPR